MPKYRPETEYDAILAWAELHKENLSHISDLLPSLKKYDLPPAFKKVLIIKYLPGSDIVSIAEKSKLAGITPRHWWNIVHDKRFIDAAIQFVKENLGRDVGEIWSEYLREAKYGATSSAERILTELGVLKPSKSNETNITVNVAVVEETRQKNLETGLNRFRFTLKEDE